MQQHPRIIGLSGTNGSGKDTVGHLLAEHHQFLFVSVTDLLREEAKTRGVPVDREHLRGISAEWRREAGLGVLVDKAFAKYETIKDQYPGGLAVASLRNPGEADRVHQLGGRVVWVDAEPRVRYDRVQANADSRGRAEEDRKTFEEFLDEQAAEMHPSGDEATLDMAGVKAQADTFIDNNSSSVETFQKDVEHALGL
jgi:cytidylate kinase